MTPDPAQHTPGKSQDRAAAPSAQASEIALLWRRYLGFRDDRSHDQLLRAVDRLVRHEARRMLAGQSYLAEETAQEALLGIERKIGSLEMPDQPVAFIRKVVSNKVATTLQRESRRRAREERNWSPDVSDPDITSSTEYHDFLGILRESVSDDEFWTLVLRYHFDFSYDEIGELLEKETGAIRQIALRGRQKCRQRLSRLEGRAMPMWVGLPIEDEQWQLLEPDESAARTTELPATPDGQTPDQWSFLEHGPDDRTAHQQSVLEQTPHEHPPREHTAHEVAPQAEAFDRPSEIAARQAGQWGQDISDSAGGLRRTSLGSDSSAPREPKTTRRRFGQLTVHAGTATSRLGFAGRRWLYTAPSSILPLVVLVAVPALAFSPDVDALALVRPTISSEPIGPTFSATENAGGGSAGADRAGRQGEVERPINQPPTGPAQSNEQTGTGDTASIPSTTAPASSPSTAGGEPPTATTQVVSAGEPTDPAGPEPSPEPTALFDLAIPPSGPGLPVPEVTTTVPVTSTTVQPAATTTAPTTIPTTSASTTTAPTTAPTTTTQSTTTTAAPTTTTTQPTTTTTTAATTTTTQPTTTTTTTPTTTTITTTTTTTTTAPTTTTTAPTTTTTQPTTTTSTAPSTTTTDPSTTTTEPSTTTTEPPIIDLGIGFGLAIRRAAPA
ncbi:MAG: sigma-70 family RNA polymerase sigma factor [Actinomycetota bacterium]